MPVTYQIDGRLVRLICVGSYAPRDIRQTFLTALADPSEYSYGDERVDGRLYRPELSSPDQAVWQCANVDLYTVH